MGQSEATNNEIILMGRRKKLPITRLHFFCYITFIFNSKYSIYTPQKG